MTFDRTLVIRWRWVIAYTAVVYSTLPLAPALRGLAVEIFGPRVFTGVVLAALAGAAVALLGRLRWKPGETAERWASRSASWAFVLLAYLGLIVKFGSIPVEQIHILMYGLMGVLVYGALDKRRPQRVVFARAVGIVFAIGLVDEFIQKFLPNRVYDVRDILMNGVTGLVTQLAIVLARAEKYSELPPTLLRRVARTGTA
ncbi:MAG: VanZ family protein [Myxococcales bacterium]|nr:VanZ family protein [Myxococcales bacterium]